MFKNEVKNRMMAMAVVAMFMLSAVGVAVVSENGDATDYSGSYDIYMATGDSFSYTPTANLVGTVFTISPSTGVAGLTVTNDANGTASANASTNTTMTYAPTEVPSGGTQAVTVTAAHSDSGQSKTQTLTFHIVAPVAITQASNVTINASVGNSIQIASLTKTGGFSSQWGSMTVELNNEAVTGSDNPFVFSNGTISTKSSGALATGAYDVTVTATDSAGGSSNQNSYSKSVSMSFTITIAAGVDFDISYTPASGATYVGNTGTTKYTLTPTNVTGVVVDDFTLNSVTTTTSATMLSKAQQTVGFDAETAANNVKAVTDNGAVDITIVNNAFSTSDAIATPEEIVVNITMHAHDANNSSNTMTVTHSATIKMYMALEITSAPTASDLFTYHSSGNSLDAVLTINAKGATKMTYNWGDGTVYTKTVSGIGENLYVANHTYAKAGTYFIQVTAANDFGSKELISMYTTGFELSGPQFTANPIKAEIVQGTGDDEGKEFLQLTAKWSATNVDIATLSPDFEWTYQTPEMDEPAAIAELDGADVSVPGVIKVLITENEALKDDTVFNVKMTVSYADQEFTAEKSYTYNDTSFFGVHGWQFIIFAILFVVLIALFIGAGFNSPYIIIAAVVFAILAILCFVFKDVSGIIDALAGLFKSS